MADDTLLGGANGGAAGAGGAGGAGGGANGGDGKGGAGAGGDGKGAGGGAAASWRDALPDDLKSLPSIQSFTDLPNLVKAFANAQSLVGKKGAIVPGDKATDEEWSSFYKAIGVPELDKYDVTLPKDVTLTDEALKKLKETAAKNGLLPKQTSAMLALQQEISALESGAAKTAAQLAYDQQIAKLKTEWGDGWDLNVTKAKATVQTMPDDLKKTFLDPKYANDPNVLRLFNHFSGFLSEDRLREGGVQNQGGRAPAEIQAALAELRAKGNENGLFDAKHPMHNVTLAKMESLAKQLTGGR